MDDTPDTIDLESVRRDLPVEYRGRVNRLGFREGIVVTIGLVVVLAGLGLIGLGPGGPGASASASTPVGLVSPTAVAMPSAAPSLGAASPAFGPTPAVTPAGRCARLSSSLGVPFVSILSGTVRMTGTNVGSDWLSAPAASSDWGANDAVVPLAEPVVLSISYAACALEWRITAGGVVLQEQANPRLDPAYASQGYFVVNLPASAKPQTLLRIDLHFELGWTSVAWLVTVVPLPVPDAFLAGPGESVYATPGCGFAIRLRNGVRGSETCVTTIPDPVKTLYVAPGSALPFRVPSAIFNASQEARVTCGHAVGSPPALVADPACDIQVAYDPSEDFGFLAPTTPGVWLVEVTGCARRDVGDACGPWFVGIDTQNPQPSDPEFVN